MLEQKIYFGKLNFPLCIFTWFSLHCVVRAQIPLNSKLSVDENNFWLSSNGNFAFGFFSCPDQPNQYRIGVRFSSKSIPPSKQIVIWVAGADITVGIGSYFQLTKAGELVLFDVLKEVPVWTSKTSQLSVVSGALHDNGNLVLINLNNDIVWQSFDTPSDTLVPGQNFTPFKTLRASSRSSVSSYYTLFMNISGKLELRWESEVIYWTSESPSISNLSAFLTSDGALQLRDQKFKPVWSVYGEDHNDQINFRFLRIDYDGNLRLYSWIKDSQTWRSVWQAVENPCNVFATCGENGVCVLNSSGFTNCKCPFNLTNDSSSTCLAPFRQDCKSGSTMLMYKHTYLYGIYPPNDPVFEASLSQCQSLCLKNPLCTAVTYTNDGTRRCFIKETRYITGYSDPSESSVSFVKKCLDPLAVDPKSSIPESSISDSPIKGSYKFCVPCLIGAVSGTFLLFIIVHLGIGFLVYRRRNYFRKKALLAYAGHNSKGLIVLSFSEIKDLTGNFTHLIGQNMFKGVLPNKLPVAIKDLEVTIEERKFRSAVSKIGSIHHRNLVKLEGYCCEASHRFVIYEFARNGSLDKHLEESKLCKTLTWRKRFEICIGVARALCYLHTECREFVSHGNLKCENVVLDENLEAKVTGFGLGLHASAEKDVEDFGKMVLMIISGRTEVRDFYEWAYNEWTEGRRENVVDRKFEGGVDLMELERSLRISFWCLQVDERMRPSMGEVVKVLEGTLNVDPPPPFFACRSWPDEDELLESGSQ